jgi:hypothetical protein
MELVKGVLHTVKTVLYLWLVISEANFLSTRSGIQTYRDVSKLLSSPLKKSSFSGRRERKSKEKV